MSARDSSVGDFSRSKFVYSHTLDLLDFPSTCREFCFSSESLILVSKTEILELNYNNGAKKTIKSLNLRQNPTIICKDSQNFAIASENELILFDGKICKNLEI
jgi:hypothetical protein